MGSSSYKEISSPERRQKLSTTSKSKRKSVENQAFFEVFKKLNIKYGHDAAGYNCSCGKPIVVRPDTTTYCLGCDSQSVEKLLEDIETKEVDAER